MKRIWFAVAFLVIATGSCIGEQCFINSFNTKMTQKTTAAQTAAEAGDMAALENEINEIKDYWDKNNDLLCALSNHDLPNELGARIRAADAKNETIEEELSGIKALNNVFFENNRITFANII